MQTVTWGIAGWGGPRRPTGLASSASGLPLWGSGNPGAFSIEGRVSALSHKGSKVTRSVAYRSQKWRDAVSPGKGSPPSQVASGKGREIKVTGTYYLSGGRGANFLQAPL